MLNLCIDWKEVQVEFKDETITAEIRPPSPQHMLIIAPHMNFEKETLSDNVAMTKIYDMQKAVEPILPELIRNIKGVEVNGEPLNPSLLGSEAALGMLCIAFITEVFIASNLDKESEKNLPLQRSEPLQGAIADR